MIKNKIKDNKGSSKILVIILIVLILVAGGLLVVKVLQSSGKTTGIGTASTDIKNEQKIIGQNVEKAEEKKTVTMNGNERPIAFMIDNNINAMPQAGLLEADLIYEIIVEGGETRLMLVIKNKDITKIGPLRSARHYFLDYALESDAIYIHYGQSPQAKSDITKLGVSAINGINESSTSFWRVNDRYAPHNAVTSIEKVNKIISRKEYRTTTNKKNVLNYVANEVELDKNNLEGEKVLNENDTKIKNSINNKTGETNKVESVKMANKVTIPYSVYNTVRYEYNEKTKTYTRYSRNKKQVDWESGETIKVKNIIITKAKNTTLNDGSNTGRQTIDNIKTLDGYYITNGKAIEIKCEKNSREGQTVYKDLEGNEIEVNDGKTFIQICPIDSKIKLE